MVTEQQVREALRSVLDPEIGRPIEDLGMLRGIQIEPDGLVRVYVLLTIEGCPLKDRINNDVTAALSPLDGVERVEVSLAPMSEEQRASLVATLRGGNGGNGGHGGAAPQPQKTFFTNDDTSVIAVASGKGGVGKSSVTVNLACALAAEGHRVGHPRRGRVGVQRPEDARGERQAGRVQRHDPAARVPRGEGHLDGVLRPGGDPGDLARPDAPQGDRAVPGGRVLGRDRLPAVRPAAGNRRRLDQPRVVPSGRVDARRDHAAGGGSQGRRTCRQDGGADEPSAGRRHREHVVVRVPALRRTHADLRRGRRAARPPRRWGCRCSHRCRSCRRSARAATRGRRSSSTTPTAAASEALRGAARELARLTRSKVGRPLPLMATPGAAAAAGGHHGHAH